MTTPGLNTPFVAGLFDQNPPHGLSGSCKEVPPAVPVLGLLNVHQPQVSLMDKGRRLERLAGLLLRHLLCRQFAQLVVDQRQELLGGVGVTLIYGREDAGDVGHEVEDNQSRGHPQANQPPSM